MSTYNLKYNCGPVAQQFHADRDSRVKLLIGPFGCLSGDTEYLSKRGWVRFDEWQNGDIVAEYNHITGSIEWRTPKNYVKLPCPWFYHLNNKRTDQMLSPEHTILYNTKYGRKHRAPLKTIKAHEMVEKHNSLRDGWDGEVPTTFTPGPTKGVPLSDGELRLMVAVSADGYLPKYGTRCVVVLRRDRKKARLRHLLKVCDIDWAEYNYEGRPTETVFKFAPPQWNKRLWQYIEADQAQLAIINDEWPHWDGCTDSYGGKIFSSTVKENADFIQYVAATQGERATIAKIEYDKEWADGYRVYVNTGGTWAGIRDHGPIPIVPSSDGFKYCFESTTGFFVARRNGKIFVTGNTGKTSSAAFDLIEIASQMVLPGPGGVKRSRFAVVRNTYPELRDTTIKSYFDWFPEGVFGIYNNTDKTYKIKYDGREIEIIFKALDSPKDVRDLLSLELTGAHVDEAREIHQDVVKGLLGRVGRYPSLKSFKGRNPFITPPQVVLTTNYPSTQHWLYRDFVENPIKGYKIYEQSQEENKHNLRPGYYEDLAHDYANRPDLLKTLVQGSWGVTVAGKLVYPEFNRRLHVSTEPLLPTRPTHIIRGWDNTGLSPAINLSYISPAGQWRIFKEFCWEDAGIDDATEEMIVWCNMNLPAKCTFQDIGDPAGKQRDSVKKTPARYIAEKAKEYNQHITIQNGVQTFKIRREAVAGRLNLLKNGEPAILIDRSCTMIIDGFDGGYAYPEIGNTGMYRLEPAKNEYSHIHDSIQYPATILFKPGGNSKPKSVSSTMEGRRIVGAWG